MRNAPRQESSTSLWQILAQRITAGNSCALATVLESRGSTPVKAGAKAILNADGAVLAGTVGGGAVEAETQSRARAAIQSGHPALFEVQLQGDDALATEPICGGSMRVLIDPTVLHHLAAYTDASLALNQRRRGVLITRLNRSLIPPSAHPKHGESGRSTGGRHGPAPESRGDSEPAVQNQSLRTAVTTEWIDEGSVPKRDQDAQTEAIHAALRNHTSHVVSLEWGTLLVEPVLPDPLLVIVGGGHVGQAVARQATWVGFQVQVIEDRQEFTHPGLFPEGTLTVCGAVPQALQRLEATQDTYVVLVSRGHRHDAAALEVCIRRPWAYLGMIGSKRKVALLRQEFIQQDRATSTEFDRVYAPIGLDLGAVTVPEIATSIVAQLIAVRRKKTASRMPAGTASGDPKEAL